MSRYIDADALDKRIYNDIPISVFGSIKKMAAVREIIAEQPTVDAVLVVRCKDCVNAEDSEVGMVYCPHIVGSWVAEDFYCADGERRTDEQQT